MNPSEFDSEKFDKDDFPGIARLFPIPNLVMFPHVVQPLHVFEERYCEMMTDALASDSFVAMPILQPGWEAEYESRPAIGPWACLGRVVLHKRLPEGHFNILLMGLARVKVERELDPLRSFRQAEVSLIDELVPEEDDQAAEALHEQLTEAFRQFLARQVAPDSLQQLPGNIIPLGHLTDLMAYALPLGTGAKQKLLGEPSVLRRGEYLMELLGSDGELASLLEPVPNPFPPPFSVN